MDFESKVNIFAYGSNMCTSRMRARAPSAQPYATGFVRRRHFAFHKRGADGSAKADAAYSGIQDDQVWGVVFRLPAEEKPLLDAHEFLGIGYDQEQIEVAVHGGSLQAWMYVARSEACDSSLLPYSWYHAFIVHGAHEHQLPESYLAYLQSFETLADPDRARHLQNHEVIGFSGPTEDGTARLPALP